MPNFYDHFSASSPFTASQINLELDKLDAQIKTNEDDVAAISFNPAVLPAQCRLSLSSSLPVTVSNVTAAATLYLHPFGGQTLPLYDGANWVVRTLASTVNLSIPATTSTVYDVFAYWNGSAIVLEAVAWSSATARATALTTQDGINVKTGETTKRYVGSFRTTAVSGQCEDSVTKRYLWNMYNRKARALEIQDATANWVYTTATWHQTRATTSNKVELVIGLSEDIVELEAIETATSTTGFAFTGVGVDSTTVNSAEVATASVTHFSPATARYKGFPGVGYHALNWLEIGGGAGTTTWYGPGGMSGAVWA